MGTVSGFIKESILVWFCTIDETLLKMAHIAAHHNAEIILVVTA